MINIKWKDTISWFTWSLHSICM